ncbi:MAG: sugar phosphate nucleotidyltransferase, partial [Pseudomonadota bacterium]
MAKNRITPIILAGGNGTRLWPASREAMPKQFCDLGFGETLFQTTLLRVENRMLFNPPIIVCNESHANVVTTQADALGIELGKIICEPAGRDTA